MRNERVAINILGKELELEIEGLDPLEVPQISAYVDEKAGQLRRELKIVDTLKLQYYLIAELATEIHLMKTKLTNLERAEEKHIDGMIVALKTALDQKNP